MLHNIAFAAQKFLASEIRALAYFAAAMGRNAAVIGNIRTHGHDKPFEVVAAQQRRVPFSVKLHDTRACCTAARRLISSTAAMISHIEISYFTHAHANER